MHLVYAPKFNITIVFNFFLGITVVPREIEDNGYIRQILGDKQGGLASSFKLWSLCPPSQKTSRSIANFRCISMRNQMVTSEIRE